MPSRRPRRAPSRRAHRRTLHAGLLALAGSAALATGAAAAPVEPPTLLAAGSRGPAVGEIQRALHVHPSSHFDPSTRRAVVRFQRRHHLLVDGVIGAQTWDALFHIPYVPAAVTAAPSIAAPSTASSGGGYTIPSGIVQCESGGNYSAVNPSSGAGGAYQILPSTWQAYGGQGLPENAPPAEQDRIAAAIYANQGASAWTC
jgi:peptidoglycan hydrolase-like protein with peptidoglycan-binding domain